MKTCNVIGCQKVASRKRGMCNAHYIRWYRHGDPLAGKSAHGAAMKFFEDVVLAHDANECLSWPYSRSNGYATVRIANKMRLVSRMVCERVHGDPPSQVHEAAHSCGKGTQGCVSKQHLFWKTPKENSDDKLHHGTHPSQMLARRLQASGAST